MWCGGQPGTVAGDSEQEVRHAYDRPASDPAQLLRWARLTAVLAAVVLAVGSAANAAQQHRHHHHPCHAAVHPWRHAVPPWLCAKRLARSRYGWTGYQWHDLDYVVSRESGWDSCSHWPGVHHDCAYNGAVLCSNGVCSNACGIPQATPCPTSWRGHLDRWRQQVRWLLRYVKRRYGDPATAYAAYGSGGY